MQKLFLFIGVIGVIASCVSAVIETTSAAEETKRDHEGGHLRTLPEDSSNIHFAARSGEDSDERQGTGPGMPGMPGRGSKPVQNLPDTLRNFPSTFTTGFARQDFYELPKKQYVQSSVTTLGVCALFDPSTARRFQPPPGAPTGIQSFKVTSLVFKSSTAAELTYAYYTNAGCTGSAAATNVVAFPVTQTVVAANGVKLTAILSYVQQLSDAVRLIPSTIGGFINAEYYAAGCGGASIFRILGTTACSSFTSGFGRTTCDASGVTAFNYQYPQDKTCSKASTVVFQRPLTCAPILFNGVPVSDFQIFTCV